MKERNRKIKEYVVEKKRQEEDTGLKANATAEDIEEITKRIEELEDKKHEIQKSYKSRLQTEEDRIHRLLLENRELDKQLRFKQESYRMTNLKIKEFKRIMQSGHVNNGKKSRGPVSLSKHENFTPAKNNNKMKKEPRSNSSRRTLEDTFKSENTDEPQIPQALTSQNVSNKRRMFSQNPVKEAANEDDYGSDFDQYNETFDKSEPNNTKDFTLDNHAASLPGSITKPAQPQNSVTSVENTKPPQMKATSKPSFMMKRKF